MLDYSTLQHSVMQFKSGSIALEKTALQVQEDISVTEKIEIHSHLPFSLAI